MEYSEDTVAYPTFSNYPKRGLVLLHIVCSSIVHIILITSAKLVVLS